MAAGPATRVSDVVVPDIFTAYALQQTEEKSRIIQSGVAARNATLDEFLAGGGLTVNVPSFRPVDQDADRVSTDTVSARYTGGTADPDPFKIGTSREIAVRLSRNNSWSHANLAVALAGASPLQAIAAQIGTYWAIRLQKAFIAGWNGVIADNAAAPSGGDTHTQNDLINDVSGASFQDGVTNLSAEHVINTALTMGDSMDDLTVIAMHSVVYARALKNNLIDFVSDSANPNAARIATFLQREVIVDDGMPAAGNVYDTWLFGRGATQLGMGSPRDTPATETERIPGAGNGGGQDVLHNRVEWSIHPVGYQYKAAAPNGGPDNSATAPGLANLDSWSRTYPQRKQIKFARLVTREA